MLTNAEDKLVQEAVDRIVNTAKHFPMSIEEWRQCELDVEEDDIIHLHASDAIQWAISLRDQAKDIVQEIVDSKRAVLEEVRRLGSRKSD